MIGNRHPATLGRPLLDSSTEIAPEIEALFRRALAGESVKIDSLVVAVDRGGTRVPVHFSIGCTPIFDAGAVAGVMCLSNDVTASVLEVRRKTLILELSDELRQLDQPRGIVQTAVSALGRHLAAQRVGYGEVQEDDRTIMLETSYVDGLSRVHGRFELDSFGPVNILRNRQGITIAHDDVTLAEGQNPETWQAIETRSFASVPLIREGRLRATLFVNFREPHLWTDAELALVEDVAARIWDALERARAEDSLHDSQARLALSEESLRLAADAGEVGIWDLDLTTDTLTWPPRTKAMFGMSAATPCSMADFYAGLHPDDRAATTEAFLSAIDPAQRLTYDVEYRTIGKEDGVIRWVAAKGHGLFDAQGRCVRALGTAIDITRRKTDEATFRAQSEALERAQESLAAIFNASSEGLTLCRLIRDDAGKVTDYQVLDVNPSPHRLTGATRQQMLSMPVSQIAPPVNPRWFISAQLAVASGQPQSFEVRSPVTGRWLDIHVSPVSGDLFAQTFIDVTGRHEMEAQRMRLLAEMNHRVKNNFQMVASVLDLQARRTRSEEVRDQLKAAQRRIYLLAELHDCLAISPDADQIDFQALLQTLCAKLGDLIETDRIQLRLRSVPARFGSALAMPLGFIVNELVSTDEAGYRLVVRDGGRGLPKTTLVKGIGLGMRLVSSFVAQIGAGLTVTEESGVEYTILVPHESVNAMSSEGLGAAERAAANGAYAEQPVA
jgi:PAS domain S-box-containing protein